MAEAAKPGATRLAVVGASARAAAFSAIRAGFEVVAADLFADADLTARCPATRIVDYPSDLEGWLAQQDVDAWIYTGALENHPDLVDRLASIRPLWGNAGEPLRRVRDPVELQSILARAGVPFPETRRSAEGLPLDGTWFCKTYRGSSGSGVWLLDSEEALARAAAEVAVFQKRIVGTPASAVSLLLEGRVSRLEGLTEQLVGEPCFAAGRWSYCGSVERPDWSSSVELHTGVTAALAIDAGLVGVVGIDLVYDGANYWVVEVNPRFTASCEIVESFRPRSVVAGHAVANSWRRQAAAPRSPAPPRLCGKAICFAKEPVVVPPAFGMWAIGEAASGRVADVPVIGAPIDVGQPIITVLAGEPAAGVRSRLEARAQEVYRRLALPGAGG
ncbi:MAG: ATP-grasp domain-containing protein [Planctomycetota bacterium]